MTSRTSQQFLFELSGEHKKLPIAELRAVIDLYCTGYVISELEDNNRYIVLDLNIEKNWEKIINNIGSRLAMCKNIYHVLKVWPNDFKIVDLDLTKSNINDLPNNSTFKLITKKLSKDQDELTKYQIKIRNEIINSLSEFYNVDVKSPEIEFFLFLGLKIVFARKVMVIDRSSFEIRKPQLRPFNVPISLHPRLARCLVNLGGVQEDMIVLDPFCGTGGILIEAAYVGAFVVGSDIEKKMIEGTEKNLRHQGIDNFHLVCTDIRDLPKKLEDLNTKKILGNKRIAKNGLNMIITDPPYGRATSTKGEPIEQLMNISFQIFSKLLSSNGVVVIALPNKDLVASVNKYFDILGEFTYRIHRTLTKHIFILRKN